MAQNNFSEISFECKNATQETDKAATGSAGYFDPLGLFSEAKNLLKNRAVSASAKETLTAAAELVRTAARQSGPLQKSAELSKGVDSVANKLIDSLKDNPLENIQTALKKLDNLVGASITRKGQTSHIDINLAQGKTVAPPDVQVSGFRPVASHLSSHLSFDMAAANAGVLLSNMNGFSASVRGPLGKIRHSETTSMFIGKDACGPYVSSSSDLYIRRRVHSSTTVLREKNFSADSPMRSAMQHPEALDQVGSMMRMFRKTEDQLILSMKRSGNDFDLKSEAVADKHIDLDFKPENLKVPVTVKSIDLDKTLSATLNQSKDSVVLSSIKGLKVNVEIAGLKASLNPGTVSLERDSLKLELKNPSDGSILPVFIPILRLREAGGRK